ncbi:MAG: lamin tail domain-containing protein, partial [Planctomycetota bacterium]
MRRSLRILLLSLVFIASLAGSALRACPVGDVSGNCTVDLHDLRLLAEQWLDPAGSADLDDINGVNMVDFAMLGEDWRKVEAPLLITEFMASNRTTLIDGDGGASDWIEIYNPTDTNITLTGWCLTDDYRDLTKWPFPDGLIIDPSQYLVVFASGQDDANYPYLDPNGYYHTNFKLDKAGEYLALVAGDGKTIAHDYDSFEYDDDEFGFPFQKTDFSYGLVDNDPNQEAYFDAPATPGAENGSAVLGLVADTKFNYDRGFYEAA